MYKPANEEQLEENKKHNRIYLRTIYVEGEIPDADFESAVDEMEVMSCVTCAHYMKCDGPKKGVLMFLQTMMQDEKPWHEMEEGMREYGVEEAAINFIRAQTQLFNAWDPSMETLINIFL